jgi:hypothetical protein
MVGKLDIICRILKIDTILSPYIKINIKWIRDNNPDLKCKTITKDLEEGLHLIVIGISF